VKKDNIDRFIELIQFEVNDDIKMHVLDNKSIHLMEHLQEPVVNYVVAMVLDNLCKKALLGDQYLSTQEDDIT
jgi:hypothetical protein